MYRRRGLGDASPQVQQIAQAFATAEGGLTPGTFPYRTNNPCDIFAGGSTAGYPTMDAGWQACYNQIGAILNNTSSIYSSDMSISDIASHYAPASAGNDPNAWAANVAASLGLSPSDPLTAVGGSGAQTPADSSIGLQASTSAIPDFSDVLSSLDSGGSVQFLDDSGNLTGLGWGAIALAGLAVFLVVS